MALIGEQFDEADEICGVVASVRQKQDKLSLWTKTAANEAAQVLPLAVRNLTLLLAHNHMLVLSPLYFSILLWNHVISLACIFVFSLKTCHFFCISVGIS